MKGAKRPLHTYFHTFILTDDPSHRVSYKLTEIIEIEKQKILK